MLPRFQGFVHLHLHILVLSIVRTAPLPDEVVVTLVNSWVHFRLGCELDLKSVACLYCFERTAVEGCVARRVKKLTMASLCNNLCNE